MVKRNDGMDPAQQRMKAELLELVRANEALKQELAGQQITIDALKDKAKNRRNVADLMAEWHWELDENFSLSSLKPPPQCGRQAWPKSG